MQTPSEHQRLVELVKWIDQHFSGIELPADRRSRLGIGCFDVALEHQAAIAVLAASKLYGSMFALIRVLFEAYVRGFWLTSCASELELDKFEKHRIDKEFGELIKDIEAKIDYSDSPLSALKANSWKAMNSFTHTGFMQVVRRNGEDTTGPNYDEEEITKALGLAGALGLFTAAALASLNGDCDLIKKTLLKTREYAGRSF